MSGFKNVSRKHRMNADPSSPQALISLLRDAANATLWSETLWRNYVRCINRKQWCKKLSKRCKTFAMTDGSNTVQILVACAMQGIRFSSINCLRWGRTKETGSQMKVCAIYVIQFTRMNCLWLGNTKETVSQIKVCAIEGKQFTRSNCLRWAGRTQTVQPDQGVCNGGHIVHSDKLFVLIQENRNVSHKQDVCNTRQTSNYIGG